MDEALGTCDGYNFPHKRHENYCANWRAASPQASVPGGVTALRLALKTAEAMVYCCGHPRGGCPNHCDLLVKVIDASRAALKEAHLQRESQPPDTRCNYYFGGFDGGERCQRQRGHAENESEGHEWRHDREPAQAEAGRPTEAAHSPGCLFNDSGRCTCELSNAAPAEKRLVAEYARNTSLAAPLQGERALTAIENNAVRCPRCLTALFTPRHDEQIRNTAERAGIEKGLEMAAQICDGVNPNRWVTGCDAWELSKAIRARKETP